MNLKYSVVIILLVLIVISMRTEFNEEQSYCDKFSGQSSNASASEDYLSCENTAFCKTIKHQKSPSNTISNFVVKL